MLNAKAIPKIYWPEATTWYVHILNRSPTSAIENNTPEGVWSDKRPSVSYFRVFKCVANVHVPKEKRRKLDDMSIRCVMFGVSEEAKAYRLYNRTDNKIIISKDVVFEEDETWPWNLDQVTSQQELVWEEGTIQREENDDNNPDVINESLEETNEVPPIVESREKRRTKAPGWMNEYVSGEALTDEEEVEENFVLFSSTSDPSDYYEAVLKEYWKLAMKKEMEAIEKNDTWELCILPPTAKAIGLKWFFKTKLNKEGKVEKYKARLVVKGYAQKHGIDYTEVFAPVARWDTIRTIFALAAQKGMVVHQLDVKSAFLYGELAETVYIEQPQGFEKEGDEEKVYKLKKALYGLKQSPRAWYGRIEAYFNKEGFQKCPFEPTFFVKSTEEGEFLIVSIYVDDLIVTGTSLKLIEEFKALMKSEFDMTDMGEMRYFLGVEVIQNADGIYLSQRKYAREMLERFNMKDCNYVKNPIVPGGKLVKNDESGFVDATLYKQMVGCMMYLAATRPDLMFVISLLSRFMETPTEQHMAAMKRVLRYIKGTVELGVFYKRNGSNTLVAYSDSDYAGDYDSRRSTSGYVCFLSGAAIAWSSKRQPIVTLSTTEAEFVAATACACQVVWLRRIFECIGLAQKERTVINCDNMSTIKLSKNPVMHNRSKHIDVRFYFLRDRVNQGVVEMKYCNTLVQAADIMTKPSKLEQYEKQRSMLGMCEVPKLN